MQVACFAARLSISQTPPRSVSCTFVATASAPIWLEAQTLVIAFADSADGSGP